VVLSAYQERRWIGLIGTEVPFGIKSEIQDIWSNMLLPGDMGTEIVVHHGTYMADVQCACILTESSEADSNDLSSIRAETSDTPNRLILRQTLVTFFVYKVKRISGCERGLGARIFST